MRDRDRSFGVVALVVALAGLLSSGCGGAAATASGGASSSTGNANGDSFVVDLERPYVAGQRYRVRNVVMREEAQHATLGGRTVEDASHVTTIALRSVVEIVEVSAEGRATLLRHQVEDAGLSMDGTPRPFLTSGQVIEVRTGATAEEAVVTIDGRPVGAELLESLRGVLTLSHGGADEDRLFGSASPRRVGETWQPDLAAVAADLARATPFRLEPAHMAGEMRLMERRPDESLVIEGGITATDVQMTNLPAGATLSATQLTIAMSGVLPEDPARHATSEAKGLEMSLTMNIPSPEGTVVMQMRMRMRGELDREAL
jgi:hypothetical protein